MNLNLPPVHTAENQPPIARDNHPLQPNQIFIPSSGTIAQQKIDTSLSMRSPPNTPPNTLPKIAFISTDKFSINTIIAAKEKEYAAQAIQAPSVFSETHPLSALFWEATSTENSYTKINKLLDETINIFQNLSEKNKNKFSSQSLFRKYLLKKSSDIQKLLPFIKEFCHFLIILDTQKNSALTNTAFGIFPPQHEHDFQCIEGTRVRLMEAFNFINREIPQGMGLLSDINASLAKELDQHISQTITKNHFGEMIAPAYQIHTPTFLHYIVGVNQTLISGKDRFFLSPMAQIPAPSIYNLLTGIEDSIDQQTIQTKEKLTASVTQFSELLDDNNFEPDFFNDLKRHPLIEFIKVYQPSFDLSDKKYITLDDEIYLPHWNKNKIISDIAQTIKINIFTTSSNETPKSYADYFTLSPNIISAQLLGSDINKNVEALSFLYSIGENLLGASPILFIKILIELERVDTHHPLPEKTILIKNTQSKLEKMQQLFLSMGEKNNEHKAKRVQDRWQYLMSLPEDNNKKFNFKHSINLFLNPSADYLQKKIFEEFISGLAPFADFCRFIPTSFLNTEPNIEKINASF